MSRRQVILFLALSCLPCLTGCVIQQAESDEAAGKRPRPEFDGWPKPQVALFVTGRQFGYIEPCGCTGLDNQKGGLARRHALLKSLRAKGWDVVPLDVGNQVRRFGPQPAAKFQSTVDALRLMGYRAVAFGPDDLRLPLGELIAAIAGETGESDLFISGNANPVGFVAGHRVVEAGGMRLGIASVLGSENLKKVTQVEIEVRPPMDALKESMAELKNAECDFRILLAHASIKESREFAQAFPQIDLVVTAGGAGEPTFKPEPIEGTRGVMIQVGTKGMHAGVVGLFGAGAPIRYQRIALDSRFQDSRQMLDILATYQEKLKQQGLDGLGLRPVPHPRGEFVGSETCGECHTKAYAHWLKTPHYHATDSIAHPTERSEIQRHHDPECISCHVTGWNPQQYRPYTTGYLDLEASKDMFGNGCENCHGPGKLHVASQYGDLDDLTDEKIAEYQKMMRIEMGEAAHNKCLECHDLDNSPDFHKEGAFEEYWKVIAHPWRD